MAETIAKFRFQKYKILSSSLEIKDNDCVDNQLNIVFEQSGTEELSQNIYKHFINVNISSKDKTIIAMVQIAGWFEFDTNIEERMKSVFFNTSAPAILFPYLRAYIMTITGLSGISPIILPTLNLSNRDHSNESIEKPEI